ncbi:Protein F56A4.12 [Aphelenchoides avenae]|nr:Protein F56A4.12 [Aphelenchus avenae]
MFLSWKPTTAFQGLAQGITFPAFPAIAAEWSPIQNSGLYVAVLTCHLQLGPLVMMPLAGEMCSSSLGWPALYYLMGGMTAVAIAILFFFHEDYPRDHRWVNKKELALIELGKESTQNSSGEKPQVPYKSIFTDVVVWGILVEYYGGMIALLIFMLFGPVYLYDVLGLEVSSTGFIAALPYLISVFVKFSAGPLSDALNCISQKARVKVFGALSQFTMAGCFIALALLPKEEKTWIQVFFTAASVLNALNTVGVDKSCQLTCCQYGYVVQSVVTLSNAAITLLIPLLVGLMAPDNTVQQWSHIFWLIAGIVIIAEVVFVLTAEADPRPWTNTTHNKAQVAPVEYEAKRVSVSLRSPLAEPHESYQSTQERL